MTKPAHGLWQSPPHGAGKHGPISWWQEEPDRYERDCREIADLLPTLAWCEPERAVRGAGGWCGRLPLWPFTRPAPDGLPDIGDGLLLELVYSQAYPAIAPKIFPLDPEPRLAHYTHHRWHLNGDGSLCLLQGAADWTGRESVTDLLLKAAGWRVEFALMHAALVDSMTENGIVERDDRDSLIDELSAARAAPRVVKEDRAGTNAAAGALGELVDRPLLGGAPAASGLAAGPPVTGAPVEGEGERAGETA